MWLCLLYSYIHGFILWGLDLEVNNKVNIKNNGPHFYIPMSLYTYILLGAGLDFTTLESMCLFMQNGEG